MSRAFLCVSIDAAGDRARGGDGTPPSFLGIRDGVARRLLPLFAEHRAKPTFHLSGGVLGDPVSVGILSAAGTSCELGVGSAGPLPGDEERSHLRELVDTFIRTFGYQPTSHRAQAGASRTTLAAVEDLGFQVDGSVTPNVAAGEEPSLRGESRSIDLLDAPTQPYRPDAGDPGRPGMSRLLEVPVTVKRRWRLAPGPRATWLSPSRGDGRSLIRLAEAEIADARRAEPGRPVVLHAVLAAADVVPDGAAGGEIRAHAVLASLGALLAFARREGVAVVGLSEVPEIFPR